MRKNRMLTESERVDAREALSLLDGKVSLAECAKFFLGLGGQASSESWEISAAVDAFILARIKKGLRGASLKFYRTNLDWFAEKFADKKMDDVSVAALQNWLQKMPHHSAHSRFRSIRACYNYGKKQMPPWCSSNPALGVSLEAPIKDREIEFLSVEQCKKIMHGAPASHRPALALMLFAGVRPEEVKGLGKAPLDWGCIDVPNCTITIPASVAKTRTGRKLQHKMPENLWAWLDCGKKDGAVSPITRAQMQITASALAGGKWPHDAMRHTFATYHVAAFGDIAATAELLGHGDSLKMLKRHYQGVANKADGEEFFKIVP